MRKNLVIGSEGFIGTEFCSYLESLGEEVVRFDIKRTKKEDARSATLPLATVNRVFFLAWDVGGSKYLYQTDLQRAQLEWNLALMNNVFGQLGLHKKDFLFVSSQLSEEGDTVYGATKQLGEVWTKVLGGVTVRVWNAYGRLEAADIKSHVISDFIYQALKRGKITMLTDGREWRQFTHITDLCSAFYMALTTTGLKRTRFDASSYEWVRVIDIANMIAEMTGATVIAGTKIGHDPLPATNQGRIPGWLPTIQLKDGIFGMIEEAKIKLK
jgi:nucleoside-diphosphate-sugar epimerase